MTLEEEIRRLVTAGVKAVKDAGHKYFTHFGSPEDDQNSNAEPVPVKVKSCDCGNH